MNKKILMLPFHFPPESGSSGTHRATYFAAHLHRYGWDPIILTSYPNAHAMVSEETLRNIPPHVVVERAFSVDARKSLSYKGKYFGFTAIPDRWSTWFFAAVIKGCRLVKHYKPKVIWSTYPISTAHLIALCLSRWLGVSWVAEMRDPMTKDSDPDDLKYKVIRWLERELVKHAICLVVTTPGARDMYLDRYKEQLSPNQVHVIPNGYNEELFSDIESDMLDLKGTSEQSVVDEPFRIVHAGVVYKEERNPEVLFQALSELKKKGQTSSAELCIELRATGHDDYYKQKLDEYDIRDLVHILPALPHRECIEDMFRADGLLLLQAASCDGQIPAKAYEYLRAGKPIFALVGFNGDTANMLREEGVPSIADIADKEAITQLLLNVKARRGFQQTIDKRRIVEKYSRQSRTKELADLLHKIAE